MSALARKLAPPPAPSATTEAFAADVVAGLTATPKRLPPKYFYDSVGSELFERITELPEYYPTRCETRRSSNDHARDIAALIPPGAALVEFGSGASTKTRILLRTRKSLAAYVPVDISAEFLREQARRLAARISRQSRCCRSPPISAKPFDLPDVGRRRCRASASSRARPSAISSRTRRRRSCATPAASSAAARSSSSASIWSRTRRSCRRPTTIRRASPRSSISICWRGSTASSAPSSTSPPSSITPSSTASARASRCIWRASSASASQSCGECIDFRAGETIHTENSYKYSIESFGALARGAGWSPVGGVDRPRQLLRARAAAGRRKPRDARRKASEVRRVSRRYGVSAPCACARSPPQPARGLGRRGASRRPLARRLAARISVTSIASSSGCSASASAWSLPAPRRHQQHRVVGRDRVPWDRPARRRSTLAMRPSLV